MIADLIVNDFSKVYGTSDPLTATLKGSNGNPLMDKPVEFTINGVSYIRTTDNEGVARLNINLGIGTYPTTVRFNGDSTYSSVTKSITVRVTDKKFVGLICNGLTKTFGTPDQLVASLYGQSAKPLSGRTIEFTINGVLYKRTTNDDGQAKLNINLGLGVYECTVHFAGDSEYIASSLRVKVIVKSDTWIDGFDISKKYSDAGFFQCAVYDKWKRLNPCSVVLTINGVPYTRNTNNEGLIRLNIRLNPGDYPITVKYLGDETHNPSNGEWMVHVRPDIDTITTKTVDGYTIPSNNRGFMESKIFVTAFSYENNKKNNYVYDTPNWDLPANQTSLRFTSYEITESDGRVKTAKFTTDSYMDLTQGHVWVYITSPYHENFGGRVLSVDYDKTNGLYTYQCQDGRRQYINKRVCICANAIIYDVLEALLITPAYSIKGGFSYPMSNELRTKHAKLLSGLHPITDYDNMKLSEGIQGGNPLKERADLLSYDKMIDVITNLARNGQYPIDVWFDPSGVCHIDPIDLNKWLNQGIRLVHSDLVQYKYGFNTTNIVTGLKLKSPTLSTPDTFDDWGELVYFFGGNLGMVDPVTETTTTTTTTTNNIASGLMSGKKIFDVGQDSGIVTDYRLDLIQALRNKGHTVNDLGVGPNVVQNNGLRSSSKGHIAIYVCNGICCGTHKDFLDGMSPGGYYHYDHAIFTWVRGDIEMNRKQSRAWDDSFSSGIDTSITRQEFFNKHSDKLSNVNLWPNGDNSVPLSRVDWQKQVNAIVEGKFNNSTSSTVPNTTTSNTTTSTVMDDIGTYNKALEAMSQSIRDLLSFEIKLPLNSPLFKDLHTNQMIWTELPSDFKLANLEKIFRILPTYKVNRGVSYQENRWYIEKNVIKCDSNGLFATLTLNPFPSSYSSFSNAVKSYAEAYDQAFKQNNNNTTSNSSSNTTNTGARSPRLGNDSTDTGSMAAMRGGYRGNAGDNKNFDSAAQKGYAQQGRGYYNWARQYNSPIELAKALANRFTYVSYTNHRHSNAEQTHNGGGGIRCNCWDAARYVKCCFDAAGFDAVVITGNIYGYGHSWNAVKHNGRWYSFDLCFYVTGREWQGTNSLRLCNEW